MKRLITLLVVLTVPTAMAWDGISVPLPDWVGGTPSPGVWSHEVTVSVPAGETIYGVALDMDYYSPNYYVANYMSVDVTPPNAADHWLWPGANMPSGGASSNNGTVENYGSANPYTFTSDRNFWNNAWMSGTPSGGDWTFKFVCGNFWGAVDGTNTTVTLITEPPAVDGLDPRVFEGVLPANTTVYDEVGYGYRLIATRTGIDRDVTGPLGYRMWQGSDNVWEIHHPGGPGTVTITRPAGEGDGTRWTMFDSAAPAYAWYLSPNFVASNATSAAVTTPFDAPAGTYYINVDAMNMCGHGVYALSWTPEPGTLTLLGLVGLGLIRRR
jgi:hypothetical protein